MVRETVLFRTLGIGVRDHALFRKEVPRVEAEPRNPGVFCDLSSLRSRMAAPSKVFVDLAHRCRQELLAQDREPRAWRGLNMEAEGRE